MKKVLYASLAIALVVASCKSGQEPATEGGEVVEAATTPEESENEEEGEAEEYAQINEAGFYGASFNTEEAVSFEDALAQIADKDSIIVKVKGEVNGVCQVKGCWMTMSTGEQDMRVKFKDYAFFVPKDCSGKTAYVDGVMFREEVSVADQKHLLEDAEASQEEIDAVTEPKQELSFMAAGVMLQ